MEFHHTSVLLDEAIEYLNIKPDGVYADGTLGGAGHAFEVAKRLSQGGRLLGMDQDMDAVRAATERLIPYRDRVTVVHGNYRDMAGAFAEAGIDKADGILLDLGVSSFQLDTPERGFSYRVEDAPLDMRMDRTQALTAEDIVNEYSERELYRVIRDYGEDRFAKNIAKHIAAAREKKRIKTAGELARVISGAIPMKVQKTGGHPAKRTFQAIRIELNRELDVLRDALNTMVDLLNPHGRLCVITFHSLEDRIVKESFKENEDPCTCPRSFPECVCGKKSKGRRVVRRPVVPKEEELQRNGRSKSAKLRVFERTE